MHAQPVDPRDTSWEVDNPIFRVLLWKRPLPEGDADTARVLFAGWHSSEWDLSGTDVQGALNWLAEARVDWDLAQLFVVVPALHGAPKGLVLVSGQGPGQHYPGD